MEARLFYAVQCGVYYGGDPQFKLFKDQKKGIPINTSPIPNDDIFMNIDRGAMDLLNQLIGDEGTWKGWCDHLYSLLVYMLTCSLGVRIESAL